jgi:hypothetical protein
MDRISTGVYNSFASGYKSITGPSYLDTAVYHQYGGVPVLAFGLVATVGVVLTYATVADTFSAISESIQETAASSIEYMKSFFETKPEDSNQSEPGEQYKISGGKAKTKKRSSIKHKRISKKRKNI